MKRFVIATFLSLLIALPAPAQIDPGPDGIGIYADLEATQNSMAAAPDVLVHAYLLATNLTAEASISGWRLGLATSANASLVSTDLPPGTYILSEPPEFVVGCVPDLIMPAPIVKLATFNMILIDSAPADMYLGPTLLGEGPLYLYGPDSEPRDLNPSSGSFAAPVFRFNGEAPVPVEPASWGGVKSLYR